MENTDQVVANIDAAHRDPGSRPNLRRSDTGPALTTPTPSLDPRIVSNIKGYGDATKGYVQPAFDAFEKAYKGIRDVIDARKHVGQNTAWSPERRLLEIATLAENRQLAATKAFDSARTRLESGLAALDESLNKELTEDSNAGAVNGEIRQHIEKLTHPARQKLLDEAFKARDARTIRAVLSAPSYLTGISDDERKLRTRQFHRMTQPDVAQRADVMRKAVELIDRNAGLLFEQYEAALGGLGSWRKVQEARDRDKAARDALKLV